MPTLTKWQVSLRESQVPVTAALTACGFKKHGNYYNRAATDGLVQVVGFQSGQYTSIFHGTFTVNLGVYVPCIAELEGNSARGRYVTDAHCEIRQRLSKVAQLGDDRWWPLDDTASTTGALLADALVSHGVPFLEEYGSFAAIVRRFEIDGHLPFHNPARSALAVAVICHTLGDDAKAVHYFDEARRSVQNRVGGFPDHISEMQRQCGL